MPTPDVGILLYIFLSVCLASSHFQALRCLKQIEKQNKEEQIWLLEAVRHKAESQLLTIFMTLRGFARDEQPSSPVLL